VKLYKVDCDKSEKLTDAWDTWVYFGFGMVVEKIRG